MERSAALRVLHVDICACPNKRLDRCGQTKLCGNVQRGRLFCVPVLVEIGAVGNKERRREFVAVHHGKMERSIHVVGGVGLVDVALEAHESLCSHSHGGLECNPDGCFARDAQCIHISAFAAQSLNNGVVALFQSQVL
jgi:hypothetical protein